MNFKKLYLIIIFFISCSAHSHHKFLIAPHDHNAIKIILPDKKSLDVKKYFHDLSIEVKKITPHKKDSRKTKFIHPEGLPLVKESIIPLGLPLLKTKTQQVPKALPLIK